MSLGGRRIILNLKPHRTKWSNGPNNKHYSLPLTISVITRNFSIPIYQNIFGSL